MREERLRVEDIDETCLWLAKLGGEELVKPFLADVRMVAADGASFLCRNLQLRRSTQKLEVVLEIARHQARGKKEDRG